MSEYFLRICLLSCVFGAALAVTRDGGVKKVLSVLCTLILLLEIVSLVRQTDWDLVGRLTAKVHEPEEQLLLEGEDLRRRLDRTIIEQQIGTYIANRAEELGLELTSLHLQMRWSSEGFWLPEGVKGELCGETEEIVTLEREIAAELGIPLARQEWRKSDESEEHEGAAG